MMIVGHAEDPRTGRRRSRLLDVLGDLQTEDMRPLMDRCSWHHYRKDEQIVREFEHDDNIYLIESGTVRVTVFSDDGREVSFTEMGAGENFGELAAIDGGPRSANVIAVEESRILKMPADVLYQLIKLNPSVGIELLNQLSAMVRRLCARIFEFSTLATQGRIHAELRRLCRKNMDLDGVARIEIPPTHAEMASRVSCHREAVSRELRALEKRGVLKKLKRKWIVDDINAIDQPTEKSH